MAGLMDKAPVTEPIACPVPWTPEDAGYTLTKEEIMAQWPSQTIRPCGVKHAAIDKRWCKYKCKYGQNKKASA